MASGAVEQGKGVQTMEVVEEVQHSAESVWQAYVHNMQSILVAVMPGHFTDVSYEKGAPLTVGSIMVLSYHEDVPHYDTVKLRWDEMDHANYRFKCTLVGGGALGKQFSHLAYTFCIKPASSPSSCVMHFVIEYVDIGEHSFHDFIKHELRSFCTSLESHLQNVQD